MQILSCHWHKYKNQLLKDSFNLEIGFPLWSKYNCLQFYFMSFSQGISSPQIRINLSLLLWHCEILLKPLIIKLINTFYFISIAVFRDILWDPLIWLHYYLSSEMSFDIGKENDTKYLTTFTPRYFQCNPWTKYEQL